MYRLLTRTVAVALATMTLAGSSRADFVIDSFNAPTAGVNYQITQLNTNPWDRTDAIGNGLTRATHVEVVSPLPPTFNAVGGTLGGGAFSMDVNNSSNAFSTMTYTGFTSTTGNFSGSDGIELRFINLNPGNLPNGPVAPTMPVHLAIATVSGTMTYTAQVAGFGLPFTVSAGFGAFSGSGDLSQVTSVKVSFNEGQDARVASDFILDEIKVTAVPAPPAVFLVAAAVPALVFRRRLAKRKAPAAA